MSRLGEILALALIEIHKVTPALIVQTRISCAQCCISRRRPYKSRTENIIEIGCPGDANLHIVILQGHQGKAHGPVLAEEKLERIK